MKKGKREERKYGYLCRCEPMKHMKFVYFALINFFKASPMVAFPDIELGLPNAVELNCNSFPGKHYCVKENMISVSHLSG